ncbi:MAG: hypothetical protein QM844_20300 [Planctomycetota bacterium]|nr:hypothetical protein [Planctomycetota bacterium]
MTRATLFLLSAALVFASPSSIIAEQTASDSAEKHLLRYRFEPGETVRWQVVHLAKIKTTVSGTTQTAETVSKSVKAWKVVDVDEQGTATFEHTVEQVEMRQKLTGRQEVSYNSLTDKQPPLGFENVAKSVGTRLALITINDRGEIVKRINENEVTTSDNQGQITIPMPEDAVTVGQSWSFPYDLVIPGNNGTVLNIKTRQQFTLQEVNNGIATIRVATVILTPVRDPAIEAQLIQKESHGTVRFDIRAGRVLAQQMDLDKRVVGFTGTTDSSSLHYLTRFTEDLLTGKQAAENSTVAESAEAKTAATAALR